MFLLKKKEKCSDEKAKNKSEAWNKNDGTITVVLKVDTNCDCEGCASKVKRSVKNFEGVESVKMDKEGKKLTVVGKVDPLKIRSWVEFKINKHVEILSPTDGGKKSEDNKPNASKVSTVVLKISLHCEGCIRKIKKSILKIKGVDDVLIDAKEDLVTVKGSMDVEVIPMVLENKMKRKVEIVQLKKDHGISGKEKQTNNECTDKPKNTGGEKTAPRPPVGDENREGCAENPKNKGGKKATPQSPMENNNREGKNIAPCPPVGDGNKEGCKGEKKTASQPTIGDENRKGCTEKPKDKGEKKVVPRSSMGNENTEGCTENPKNKGGKKATPQSPMEDNNREGKKMASCSPVGDGNSEGCTEKPKDKGGKKTAPQPAIGDENMNGCTEKAKDKGENKAAARPSVADENKEGCAEKPKDKGKQKVTPRPSMGDEDTEGCTEKPKDMGGKKAVTPRPPMGDENRVEYYYTPYDYSRMEMSSAPQLFSDENPNACVLM